MLVVLVLGLTALLGNGCQQGPPTDRPTLESGESADQETLPPFAAIIERVVDGDTVIVAVEGKQETVRLLGIDTPEKAGGPRPAECFGSEASAFATELLPPGTAVHLSRDQDTRDQYGRLLAFVHRADDDLFVNQKMIETGHATALFFAPNTAARDDFTSAADRARREWIGFWDACGGPDLVLATE